MKEQPKTKVTHFQKRNFKQKTYARKTLRT